ncbi:MAG: GntR family transcriptional regulator, partial [Candidatus Promineifilaceae bacterium]
MELPLRLEAKAEAPLYRQLYEQIRALILDGALAPGARLPAERALAAGQGLARATVRAAYAQLE